MRSAAGWSRWILSIAAIVAALDIGFSSVTLAGPSTDEAAEPAEDDVASPYQPGLVAHFAGPDGNEFARLEEQVAFRWGADSPDRRVASGPFAVRFSGRLQAQVPGTYRLSVFAAGKVRLQLAGKLLLENASTEPKWMESAPVELDFGYHPLELRYDRGGEAAQLALLLAGPAIPARADCRPLALSRLGGDARRSVRAWSAAGPRLALRGVSRSARRAGGVAGAVARAVDGQSVARVARRLAVGRREPGAPPEVRRMPHFGLDRAEAGAAADFLFSVSKPPVPAISRPAKPSPKPGKKKKKDEPDVPAPEPPSAEAGATLFRSIGCLACHRVGELGTDGVFGGGDLSRIAEKRPADFFARWLKVPSDINRDHRMPTFPLSFDQADSLALYLQTLKSKDSPQANAAEADLARGRQVVEQAACIRCHAVAESAGIAAIATRSKIEPRKLAGKETCLDDSDSKTHRPGYRLSPADREAVVSYLSAAVASAPQRRRDLVAERNCLACHARGQGKGLAARLPAVAEAEAALRDLLPALLPPALDGVGDKLHDRALEEAISVAHAPELPWLLVRMPKFKFAPGEAAAIARYFIVADRIPPRPKPNRPAPPLQTAATLEAAGARLVTADGFGCTSCHAIGKWQPQKVALNARGAEPRPHWRQHPTRVVRALGPQPGPDRAADGDAGHRATGARRARWEPGLTARGRVARAQSRRLHAAGARCACAWCGDRTCRTVPSGRPC